MSYFIRVFCASDFPITRHEIASFILDGVYYEKTPIFDPSPDNESSCQPTWKRLTVTYSPDKRPIIFEKNIPTDRLFQDEIKEMIEQLMRQGTNKACASLIERLQKSQQIIAIEVDRYGITDETWEMLAGLESYLAKTLCGLIYAPDDGFYDHDLQQVCKLNEKSDNDASGWKPAG